MSALGKMWWRGHDGLWRCRGEVTPTPQPTSSPVAAFTSSLSGLTGTFDASTSSDTGSTITAYAWNYGDGNTGTGKVAAHTYGGNGTYTVTLTVTDGLNASASTSSTVSVAVTVGRPSAAFNFSTTNLAASFDGSASTDVGSTITSYAWAFGDGSTGAGKTATHTYSSTGTYTASLTVTDASGQSASISKAVAVAAQPANKAPTASIATTVSGATVSVNGSGSSDSDGTIVSYVWSWGDGTADAAGVTASHTYTTPGTYTVTLTVTDNGGATARASKSVTAGGAANQAPTARFVPTMSGATLTVNGSTSTDPDGTIASYAWTFGDGGTGTGSSSSHTYTASGVYTVTLTVKDNTGATGTASQSVTATASNPTPSGTGDSGVNQTGTAGKQQAGGTQYQTLAGSTVQAKVTAAGAAGVSFAAGTFEWPGFSGSGTSGIGINFPAGIKTILGAGSASTILRMKANSDTGHSNIASGTTGLFDTLLTSPADGWVIDGVNFQGTPQGSLLYHGMQIETPGNGTISNTTFSGFPGNSGSPPGETFGLSIHQQAAGKTLLVKNSTFDGKQVATGANVAAAICGTNTTRGVVTFQDCLFENTAYSAGLALWEIATGGTVNLIRPVFKNCHRNLGNEAQGGTINITDPIFGLPTTTAEDDIRITWTSNYNSGAINLRFTTQANLTAMMSARGGKKLTSQTTTQQNYGGSAGGVYTGSNLIYNSCHIFVAGVEIDKTPYWTVPAGR